MYGNGAAGFKRMPFREVEAVVQQPVGAGFGQPARLFADGVQVNVATVGNFLKAFGINPAQAAPAVQKAAAGIGKTYFTLNFQFVQTTFAAAVAKKLPLFGGHFLKFFLFPEFGFDMFQMS